MAVEGQLRSGLEVCVYFWRLEVHREWNPMADSGTIQQDCDQNTYITKAQIPVNGKTMPSTTRYQ